MNGDNFFYEAKVMAYFIIEGHNLDETASEFGVKKRDVRIRLKLIGYTYADLVEIRKAKKQSRVVSSTLLYLTSLIFLNLLLLLLLILL